MSRLAIERRLCDRCGATEQFDDSAEAAIHLRDWAVLQAARCEGGVALWRQDEPLDFCGKCAKQLDAFIRGAGCEGVRK